MNQKHVKFILGLSTFIYVLYLFPAWISLFDNYNSFKSLVTQVDGPLVPLGRTLTFSIFQAIILTFISIIFSTTLFHLKLESRRGRFMSLLILPFIFGSVSTAFIFKLGLLNFDIKFDKHAKYVFLSLMLFWQYGTLFIYLFWLNSRSISSDLIDYCNVSKLSFWEVFKDVVLPKQKNLICLVFSVGFIMTLFEDFKMSFLFKGSRGTGTELINSWIGRFYFERVLEDPDVAFRQLSSSSFLTYFTSILFLGFLVMLLIKMINKVMASSKFRFTFFDKIIVLENVLLLGLMIFVLFPILIVFPVFYTVDYVSVKKILPTLALVVFTAFTATVVSIIFSVFCRLTWVNIFDRLCLKSMTAILVILSFLIFPPFLLSILGFRWMKIVGYQSDFIIVVSWILGQMLFLLPVLVTFSLVAHFRVEKRLLEYLVVHKLSLWQIFKDGFWGEFRGDYVLLLVLAVATIWNEPTVNNLLSDRVPSFVSELNKSILGKGTDYDKGAFYLLFSFSLSFISLFLWNNLLNTYGKKNR